MKQNFMKTKYEITVKNEKISKISYTDNLENKITISFLILNKILN